MKVLFVVKHDPCIQEKAPFIIAQMDLIQKLGVDVSFFPVTGKGLSGYIKSSCRLRRYLKKNQIDLIHAHYSLCGLTSIVSFPGIPIVVSLMGSDTLGIFKSVRSITNKSKVVVALTFLMQPFFSATICKSEHVFRRIYRKKNAEVIPNGVDLEKFRLIPKEKARKELKLDKKTKILLFLGNPENHWKNFELARKAVEICDHFDAKLLTPFPVAQELVVNYLNAADILLVTSFNEGSSNVIKEAMACNCPIVATNVGDAEWVIGDTPGCFTTSFDPMEIAEKLNLALEFSEMHRRTTGRKRIIDLKLDSSSIAHRIIEVYEKALKN